MADMTENLVDEERSNLFALESTSWGSWPGRMRPSASTGALAGACFFLFFLDLLLPRERKRLRKPIVAGQNDWWTRGYRSGLLKGRS